MYRHVMPEWIKIGNEIKRVVCNVLLWSVQSTTTLYIGHLSGRLNNTAEHLAPSSINYEITFIDDIVITFIVIHSFTNSFIHSFIYL